MIAKDGQMVCTVKTPVFGVQRFMQFRIRSLKAHHPLCHGIPLEQIAAQRSGNPIVAQKHAQGVRLRIDGQLTFPFGIVGLDGKASV